MAVRVKVNRLRLIARLEAVRDEEKARHAKALAKYEREQPAVRKKIADELRSKAAKVQFDATVVVSNDSIYEGGSKSVPAICVESKLKLPEKPEPHHALRELDRAIALLDASDDEAVSISAQDMNYYGIGSLAGLEK